MERAIIILTNLNIQESVDLDIPLDISAQELLKALNSAFDLGIDVDKTRNCFIRAENPRVLLRGSKTLKQFGIRTGSVLYVGKADKG